MKQEEGPSVDTKHEQSRLRIALVMRDYSCSKGGAERYFVNLSRTLAKMGHRAGGTRHSFPPGAHDSEAGLPETPEFFYQCEADDP